MTRIVVQRGSSSSSSSSSSSNQNRSSTSPPSPLSSLAPLQSQATGSPQSQATSTSLQSQATGTSPQSQAPGTSPQSQAPGTSPQSQAPGTSPQSQATVKDGNLVEVQEQNVLDDLSDHCAVSDNKSEDYSPGGLNSNLQGEKLVEDEIVRNDDSVGPGDLVKGVVGKLVEGETDAMVGSSFQKIPGSSYPPPPPPMPSSLNFTFRRSPSADPVAIRIGPSRRPALPGVSIRSPPTESRPSSPRSHCEGEGYNSADEQSPSFGLGFDDAEKERQFVIDLRRVKGLEVRKMLEDGNCLFRAVADQVYGDSDLYDSVRQMCIDYMERERDHFSQFITEGFTPYCKRKRRDKVYGNNVEIQALSEMYNRPIHIYSYSTEPINIFHGNYHTDEPPILLSYHRGNHYNSLVDPRRRTIGAGLGYSSLRGMDIDEGKIKAAIKAQQDQQIDNALLAEGRLYSDIELTEKEMERTVMEASRAEYLASDMFKQQVGPMESSTSGAEPSSSAARASGSVSRQEGERDQDQGSSQVLSSSMQVLLSMGFSYMQVVEAYSIFGDDVDSMICYLIETSSGGRNKGKATEE